MPNKLLVISIDALNAKDYSQLNTLSGLELFWEKGSVIKELKSIYPTLTYCCHTSIITGTYPKNHGIFHNEVPDVHYALNQNWYWESRYIQRKTVFDAAYEKGLVCASVLWPVMAGNAHIKYNVPEIWSTTGMSNFRLFLKYGSKRMLPIVLKNQHLLNGKKQPNVDNFVEQTAIDIILKKKWDFMAIHLIQLDDARHQHGLFSAEASDTLHQLGYRITRIMAALEEKGQLENTNIILMGDHGGNDFVQAVLLNQFFINQGLIQLDLQGNVKSWTAYANGAGGSVQIMVNPEHDDSQMVNLVYHLLSDLTGQTGSPVKNLLTREQAAEIHQLDGPFHFVLEAVDGFIFRNHFSSSGEPWIVPASLVSRYQCDHGFSPEHENLKTIALAVGPDIKENCILENGSIIDLGPTFAVLLNVDLGDTDGQVLPIICDNNNF